VEPLIRFVRTGKGWECSGCTEKTETVELKDPAKRATLFFLRAAPLPIVRLGRECSRRAVVQ